MWHTVCPIRVRFGSFFTFKTTGLRPSFRPKRTWIGHPKAVLYAPKAVLWASFLSMNLEAPLNYSWELPIVFKRNTCSWKGQLERTRSWKVLSWKVWSWKVWPKLGRTERSWKEPSEVGKNWAKLERTDWSWKVRAEVGKYNWSWKVTYEVGKFKLNLERLIELGKTHWTWKDQ